MAACPFKSKGGPPGSSLPDARWRNFFDFPPAHAGRGPAQHDLQPQGRRRAVPCHCRVVHERRVVRRPRAGADRRAGVGRDLARGPGASRRRHTRDTQESCANTSSRAGDMLARERQPRRRPDLGDWAGGSEVTGPCPQDSPGALPDPRSCGQGRPAGPQRRGDVQPPAPGPGRAALPGDFLGRSAGQRMRLPDDVRQAPGVRRARLRDLPARRPLLGRHRCAVRRDGGAQGSPPRHTPPKGGDRRIGHRRSGQEPGLVDAQDPHAPRRPDPGLPRRAARHFRRIEGSPRAGLPAVRSGGRSGQRPSGAATSTSPQPPSASRAAPARAAPAVRTSSWSSRCSGTARTR